MNRRLFGSIGVTLIGVAWCFAIFPPCSMTINIGLLISMLCALFAGVGGIVFDKEKWLAVVAVLLALVTAAVHIYTHIKWG